MLVYANIVIIKNEVSPSCPRCETVDKAVDLFLDHPGSIRTYAPSGSPQPSLLVQKEEKKNEVNPST